MSALIPGVIPPQAFEVVLDRIGRIIAEELANQFALGGNPALNVNNWVERTMQFDPEEMPSVNVQLSEGTYGGQTVIQSDGTYRFHIDCYGNAKTTANDAGDQLAMRNLHRLLGVIRAILDDARYKTLGFAPPFIMNRHVESIQIANQSQKNEAMNTAMGRLIFSVKVPEITTYVQPTTAHSFLTTVKLASTDKGYQWITATPEDYDIFDFSFDSSFE